VLQQECSCQCGSNKFSIEGQALSRIICHCTTCQEFNAAGFGDITIFRSKDVKTHNIESTFFKALKRQQVVERGKCIQCAKPTIEFVNLPLFPSLTLVPSMNIPDGPALPEPSAHIFYHSRTSEVEDNLPKRKGYALSQLEFGIQIISGSIKNLFK